MTQTLGTFARGAIVASALLVVAVSLAASSGARASTVLLLYVAATLAHRVALLAKPGPIVALRVVVPLLLLLVVAPPVFSDDVHRYVWDGRVLAHGISPYASAPDAPELAALRDADWERINHPRIATIYPPVAVACFALVHRLSVHGPKLLAALAILALVFVVRREEQADRAPRGATYAVSAFPPMLVEGALEGHVDLLALAALLAGALALHEDRIRTAFAAAALAIGTKLVGVLLLPAALRRRPALALGIGLAFVLTLVPLAGSGGAEGGETRAGLVHYGRRWSGGSPGFELASLAVERSLLAAFGVGPRQVRLPFAERWLALVDGTALDPRVELGADRSSAPRTRARALHVSLVTPFVTRAVLAGIALSLAARLARSTHDPRRILRGLLLFLVLFAPRLLPWYALYLVPFDALLGGTVGLTVATVALLGHVPVERWRALRVYEEPRTAQVLGFVLVLVVLAIERAQSRERGPSLSRTSALMRRPIASRPSGA